MTPEEEEKKRQLNAFNEWLKTTTQTIIKENLINDAIYNFNNYYFLVLNLAQQGIPVNVNSRMMPSPIVQASMRGYSDVVEILLMFNAEVNTIEQISGMTALMAAAINGHEDTVKILLQKNADQTIHSQQHGKTALEYAIANKNTTIINLLSKKQNSTTVKETDSLENRYKKIRSSEANTDANTNFNDLNSKPKHLLSKMLEVYSLCLQFYEREKSNIHTTDDIIRVTNKVNALKKALGEPIEDNKHDIEEQTSSSVHSDSSSSSSWFGLPVVLAGSMFAFLFFMEHTSILISSIVAIITYFTTQTWKRFLIFGLLIPLIIGSVTLYIKKPKVIENFFGQNEKKEQVNSSYIKRLSLNISTNVSNPSIKILNIQEKFHQGIQLKPGTYIIEVKKRGYLTKRRKIQIKDENVFSGVYLEKQTTSGKKKQISRYALYIKTLKGARIQVLNIKQKYYSGIRLKPGKYKIRVSKSGYITREKTIYISNSSQYIKIPLKKQTSSLRKSVSTKSNQSRKVSIQIPDNATLNKDGKSWSCNMGYMKIRNACKRVI